MIYLVIFNLIFIIFLLNIKKRESEYFLFFILCIFFCFSYFNGSDWRNYERYYNIYDLSTYLLYPFEKGYTLYSGIYKYLGIEFFNYFILTKILCFCSFFFLIKKYSLNIYFSLLIFFTQLGLYLFIDCPLRTLISINIFFIGINYIGKKDYLYIIFVTTSFFFHQSVAIFFVLPILWKIYIKLNLSKYKLLLVISFIIFLSTSKQLLYFILNNMEYFPNLQMRFYNYISSKLVNGEILNIRLLEKILVIFIGIINKEKIEKLKNGKFILFMSIIFLILYRIGITLPILVRISLYVRIFYIFLLTYLLKIFKSYIYRIIFIWGYYFYSLISVYYIINNNPICYLPYTSYLNYIFEKKPSFEYRSNYNENEYRNK